MLVKGRASAAAHKITAKYRVCIQRPYKVAIGFSSCFFLRKKRDTAGKNR